MWHKRVAYILGTGFGSGMIPLMPGTIGSLIALLLYIFLPLNPEVWIVLTSGFFFLGVWSSNMIEKERGKDPGLVVIDEFVGQWLALFCLPRAIAIYIIGFALFRLFDIWKPFPVNRIQSLPGGWGIMLDDVLAAIYTNLCLHLFVFIVKV